MMITSGMFSSSMFMNEPTTKAGGSAPVKGTGATQPAVEADPFQALKSAKAGNPKSIVAAMATITKALDLRGVSPSPESPEAKKLTSQLGAFTPKSSKKALIAPSLAFIKNPANLFEDRLAVFESLRSAL